MCSMYAYQALLMIWSHYYVCIYLNTIFATSKKYNIPSWFQLCEFVACEASASRIKFPLNTIEKKNYQLKIERPRETVFFPMIFLLFLKSQYSFPFFSLVQGKLYLWIQLNIVSSSYIHVGKSLVCGSKFPLFLK